MSEQKSVLITGCSSGIGLCAANILKERGYRIFATARKHDDVSRLAADGFESEQLDLADSASIHKAVETILNKTDGKLYGLFNNGAYGQTGAIEDLSRDVLREQFETNFFGTHELTNLVIPVMRKQGEGRIIQNSSVLGFVTLKYRGAYNASKFAMEGLTDTLRMELKGSGVYVILIEPGPIASQFRKNAYAAYLRNIDKHMSFHKTFYESIEQRLQTEGPVVPFTLGPEAVVDKVIKALESNRPRARYYVTLPTYLFGYLKRILPVSLLDRLLEKI